MLQQTGNQHDLKSAANLKQVLSKMPLNVRQQWARYTLNTPDTHRVMDLHDLDHFLERVVKIDRLVTSGYHPKGDDRSRRPNHREDSKGTRQTNLMPASNTAAGIAKFAPTVLATQASREEKTCLDCSKDHDVTSCGEFKRKSPKKEQTS